MHPLRAAIVFSMLAGLAPGAAAQGAADSSYPSRPIRMIAPSSAGGPVDVIARVVSQGLGDVLGQQVVVDNRAGAAGLIGAELVANGTPDGYTLMFGFSGPLAIAPQLAAKRPYDATKDFAPISLVSQGQYVLLVRPSLPVSSVKDLVALARSQPGKLNYASGGNGTGIHLAGELMKLAAGVNIVHVPYKGAGPGMTALLANEVDLMFNGLPSALPHVKSGKLKALAVAGAKRSPLLPDMPTVREGGVDFHTAGWYGILAPPRTPRAIVTRVHAATMKVLGTPSVSENLMRQGVEVIGSTPEEFAKLLREEWTRTEKVIRAAGLKGQS
jgi:tripartite-type tricarboxylate transporter receptor subunit TctC